MELAHRAHSFTFVRRPRWDGERVDLLKAMIGKRVAYDEIASALQTTVGAICGKVHRLGIGKGHGPQLARTSTSFADPDDHHFDILAAQDAESLRRHGVPLAGLDEHMCKFVLGEPRHGKYCGLDRHGDSPYCQEHAKRCTSQREPVFHGRRHPGYMHSSYTERTPIDPRSFDLADGSHHPVRQAETDAA